MPSICACACGDRKNTRVRLPGQRRCRRYSGRLPVRKRWSSLRRDRLAEAEAAHRRAPPALRRSATMKMASADVPTDARRSQRVKRQASRSRRGVAAVEPGLHLQRGWRKVAGLRQRLPDLRQEQRPPAVPDRMISPSPPTRSCASRSASRRSGFAPAAFRTETESAAVALAGVEPVGKRSSRKAAAKALAATSSTSGR